MLKFRGKFLVRPEVPGSGSSGGWPEVLGVAEKVRGVWDFGGKLSVYPGSSGARTEVPGESGSSGGRGISSGTNPKF